MVNFLRLLTLAAIWGGSFLFMRMAASPLGPAVLIEARVALAAMTLLPLSFYLHKQLHFRANAKHFFTLGLFNTALPFLLFAYAAQSLNASTLAILNSTAPIWSAIIAAIWGRTPLTRKVVLGLTLGVIGVIVLVGFESMNITDNTLLPIAAGVMAALSYGIASNYAKNAPKVEAFNNAHGSMWAAVIIVLPLALLMPMRSTPQFDIVTAVVLLGVVCTGLAYLQYFRLISDMGAPSALSVTFLVPVFGILWGYLFLGEPIGLNTVAGSVLVISGTMLVTGFSPRQLIRNKVRARDRC